MCWLKISSETRLLNSSRPSLISSAIASNRLSLAIPSRILGSWYRVRSDAIARASWRARLGLSIRVAIGGSWEMRDPRSRLGARFVVVVGTRAARRAEPREVGLLDPLGVEPERPGVFGQKAAHVDRGRQLAERLPLERRQVGHADLRALRDLAQLDADRLADLAQERAGELGHRRDLGHRRPDREGDRIID